MTSRWRVDPDVAMDFRQAMRDPEEVRELLAFGWRPDMPVMCVNRNDTAAQVLEAVEDRGSEALIAMRSLGRPRLHFAILDRVEPRPVDLQITVEDSMSISALLEEGRDRASVSIDDTDLRVRTLVNA